MANTSPILIVGAGTTGLAMACELARHYAPVRIIDQQSTVFDLTQPTNRMEELR